MSFWRGIVPATRFVLTPVSVVNSSINGVSSNFFTPQVVRQLNRNARKPKKANHGKRPCSHARRREKLKPYYIKSVRFRPKLFGFY